MKIKNIFLEVYGESIFLCFYRIKEDDSIYPTDEVKGLYIAKDIISIISDEYENSKEWEHKVLRH